MSIRCPRGDPLARADLGDSDVVVLDLRGVSFVDSTGLKAIFKMRKSVREGGREFAVTKGSAQVQRLLVLTRLDEHLQMLDTPETLPGQPRSLSRISLAFNA